MAMIDNTMPIPILWSNVNPSSVPRIFCNHQSSSRSYNGIQTVGATTGKMVKVAPGISRFLITCYI